MMVQSGENEGSGAVESEVQGGFVTCRSKRFMSVAFVAMQGSSKERAPLISQQRFWSDTLPKTCFASNSQNRFHFLILSFRHQQRKWSILNKIHKILQQFTVHFFQKFLQIFGVKLLWECQIFAGSFLMSQLLGVCHILMGISHFQRVRHISRGYIIPIKM